MRGISFLAVAVFLSAIPPVDAGKKPKVIPSLEDAFRAWQKGLSSEQPKQREAAVRSMWMLTKKGVQILFPTRADRIWPHIEKMNEEFLRQVDDIAKEKTPYGAVVRVTAIDVRNKNFEQACPFIAANVPVVSYEVELEHGAWNGGPCVYVDGRWVWIIDLPDEVCAILRAK